MAAQRTHLWRWRRRCGAGCPMETHSAAIMGTSDSLNTTLRMLSGDVARGEEEKLGSRMV
jgi:hypothetical protein